MLTVTQLSVMTTVTCLSHFIYNILVYISMSHWSLCCSWDLSALCMASLPTSISYLFTFLGHAPHLHCEVHIVANVRPTLQAVCCQWTVASCRGSEWHQYRRLLLLLLKMVRVTSLLLILGIFCSAASANPQGRSLYSTIRPTGRTFIMCSKSIHLIHFGLSRGCFCL